MEGNKRPDQTDSDEINPAAPGARKIDEATFFGYSPEPVENPAEPTQASGKFLWIGFGVVVALAALVVAVVFMTAQGAAETPAPATLSQTAAEGKALFLARDCTNCHPAEGRAGGTGPRLSTTGKSDNDISNIIRRGRGTMPAHSELKDDEIAKIIAYIRAIKPPPETKS